MLSKIYMMKEIYLRKAVLDDLPILYEFEQNIITIERPFDKTLKPGHINYYNIEAMIKSADTEVIVACCNKEIIASAYASIKQAYVYLKHFNYSYLGFMYVKPEYRGIGVNKKIIEKLMNWSRAKKINELRLDVYNDNISAIRAYEKTGFKKHLINMRIDIGDREV